MSENQLLPFRSAKQKNKKRIIMQAAILSENESQCRRLKFQCWLPRLRSGGRKTQSRSVSHPTNQDVGFKELPKFFEYPKKVVQLEAILGYPHDCCLIISFGAFLSLGSPLHCSPGGDVLCYLSKVHASKRLVSNIACSAEARKSMWGKPPVW